MAEVVEYEVKLPQGRSFQFVDAITKMDAEKKTVTCKFRYRKNARMWSWLKNHFPDEPIFPGVLVVEIMNQTTTQLAQVLPELQGKIGIFAGAEYIKISKPIRPPAVIYVTSQLTDLRRGIGRADCVARIRNKVVARAIIKFAFMAPEK